MSDLLTDLRVLAATMDITAYPGVDVVRRAIAQIEHSNRIMKIDRELLREAMKL